MKWIGRDEPAGWSPRENWITVFLYVFGFADLGLGFAGIGVFQNPRLQNPGFPGPDAGDSTANRAHNFLQANRGIYDFAKVIPAIVFVCTQTLPPCGH